MSRKRRAELPERAKVRDEVFARDGHACRLQHFPESLVPPCFGHLTPHHRRRASQGGGYTMANLISACSFHNDLLEADADFAAWARALGFVVLRGDPGWEELA
jgi:5-methylcytosine-specific restriction endonuclease McrA